MNSQDVCDSSFMDHIDNEGKAYLLGWIASDGTTHKSSSAITIVFDKDNMEFMKSLCDIVCDFIDVIPHNHKQNRMRFTIHSQQICESVCRHLGMGIDNFIVRFPQFHKENLMWAFIRGYFDCYGKIEDHIESNIPKCAMRCKSIDFMKELSSLIMIPHKIIKKTMTFEGTNCVDFLGKIYSNCGECVRRSKYKTYIQWLGVEGNTYKLPKCSIFKAHEDAIIPAKSKESDVGYDLSIIKVEKRFNKHTVLYDTGIKMRVAHGYYAEVVPRSSLSKSGYMLTNSIGVIDRNYNGNVFVALTKYDEDAPEIEFPFRCCQIIFRKQIHMDMVEVSNDFEATSRGTGGFGSTGR